MRGAVARAQAALILPFVLSLSGCATEVLDEPTSSAAEIATTTVAPPIYATTLDELTVVLRDETAALSEALFAADSTASRAHLARINDAWALIEPQIAAQFGERADQLIYDLRRVIDLARSAIERNRPADADKAVRFLELALQSLAVAG